MPGAYPRLCRDRDIVYRPRDRANDPVEDLARDFEHPDPDDEIDEDRASRDGEQHQRRRRMTHQDLFDHLAVADLDQLKSILEHGLQRLVREPPTGLHKTI